MSKAKTLRKLQEFAVSFGDFSVHFKSAEFCRLCTDDFKILKIFNKLSNLFTIFCKETSQATACQPPASI